MKRMNGYNDFQMTDCKEIRILQMEIQENYRKESSSKEDFDNLQNLRDYAVDNN